MTGIVLFAGLSAACALVAWGRARARRLARLEEAVPGCSIADLSHGRFRVTGRVVPTVTTPSRIDGAACVYVESAEYRTVGSELVPVMRQVGHRAVAYPFYLDDGTGQLLVDPTDVVIEGVTLHADEGYSAEIRLRAGEEVELVATFEPAQVEADGGPYRAPHRSFRAVADEVAPPRISFRTEPGMVVATDPAAAFFGGVAVLTMLFTGFVALLFLL